MTFQVCDEYENNCAWIKISNQKYFLLIKIFQYHFILFILLYLNILFIIIANLTMNN